MANKLENERREYQFADLDRDSLNDDPFAQFDTWMRDALANDITDPTAMILSTVDAGGHPWSRIVLLKGIDASGLRFFTNYESRKGREIAGNASVSLLFPWLQMDRQVIVGGRVEKLSAEESEAYFESRPRESQLAAWASSQSAEIASRAVLDQQFEALQQQYEGAPIPKPPAWGGYLVVPESFEFWQGGEHRLHDRFHFRRTGDSWEIARLSP